MRNEWLLKQLYRGTASVIAMSVLTACSSSIFNGGKGTELDRLKGDGKFNKKCFGLDLSRPDLDVPTARGLVKCLNGNGSIQEYQDLVDKLSDAQLGVLLDVVNKEIMLKPTRLRQMSQSFDQMDQRGIVNRAMDKASKVLAKGKFIRAAINIAKQVTHTGADPNQIDQSVLQSLRILSEEISDKKLGDEGKIATRANLDRALRSGYALTQLKAFKGTVEGLRSTIPSLPGNSLDFLIRKGHEYLKAKTEDQSQAYGKVVLWGIADGTLFNAFDYYYNSECENSSECAASSGGQAPALSVDSQVQAMEEFMRMLTIENTDVNGQPVSNRTHILKPMTDLFHAMDAQINCMAGTKRIPNGDMFVMSEIANMSPLDVPQWVMRSNTMKIKLASGLCDFPSYDGQSFNSLVTVLRELARYQSKDTNGNAVAFGRPLITVSHLLKALEEGDKLPMGADARADLAPLMNYPEGERYRHFLARWLGDVSSISAYSHLTDALAELARKERGVLGNSLYFLNAAQPTPSNNVKPPVAREDLQKIARIVMKSRADLSGGRSLYDTATKALITVDVANVIEFARGISEFIDSNDELAGPLLEVTRDALLVNDVNPLIEVTLELMHDAENRRVLFQTLFDIADTQDFERAMQLTAKMAGNGTLKELAQGMLSLFKGTIDSASGEARTQVVPPIALIGADRDKSVVGRPDWLPDPATWPRNLAKVEACYKIDFDLKFSNSVGAAARAWHDQMEFFAACVNANEENPEVENFLHYGNNTVVSQGRSLLAMLVDVGADLIPPLNDPELRPIYDEIGNLMLNDATFQDMKDANRLLPLLFGKKYCSVFDAPSDSLNVPYSCAPGIEQVAVTQAAGRVLSLIKNKPEQLQKVLDVAKIATVLPQSPRAGIWLYDKFWEADAVKTPVVADQKPPLESYPLNNWSSNGGNRLLRQQLDSAIRTFEKVNPTDAIREDKYRAFWGQPNTFEDKFWLDGRGRKHYGFKNVDEVKAQIKPLLDNLSVDQRIEWQLAFMSYFDGNPYTPEWWADWFQRLSNEVRPIPYYYPNSFPSKTNPPTVRLVSQLDLLEMIVIDADFSLNELGQPLGFLFSDPDSVFAIKYLTFLAESDRNMQPALDAMERELETFLSVAADPLNIIGGALKPEVRRRLFNLRSTYHILRDMNVEHEYTVNGRKVMINDLGLLRDLFKSILSATPVADRHSYRREKNSLATIPALVKSGILRNAGVNMWFMNPSSNLGQHLHGEDWDPYHREVVPNKVGHILRTVFESTIVHQDGKREINRGSRDIVGYLLREDCDRTIAKYKNGCRLPQSAWKDEKFNERYVFLGKAIDQFWTWTAHDDDLEAQGKPRVMTNIKRAGYKLLEFIDRMNNRPDGSRDKTNAALVPLALKQMLGTKKGTQIISDNFSILENVINDPTAVHLFEKLLEGELSDPVSFAAMRDINSILIPKLAEGDGLVGEAALDLAAPVLPSSDWTALRSSVKWLRRDPEYRLLDHLFLDRIAAQVKNWALSVNHLRPRVQYFLGEHIANGDVRDLTLFVGKESAGHSDHFYRELEFIGLYDPPTQRYPYIEKLNDFMDHLRRGLQDNTLIPLPSSARATFTHAN